MEEPEYLVKIKQLMIEFHACGYRNAHLRYLSHWRTIRKIDRRGFKLWRVWNNPVCKYERIRRVAFSGCFNAYYLNVIYLR